VVFLVPSSKFLGHSRVLSWIHNAGAQLGNNQKR